MVSLYYLLQIHFSQFFVYYNRDSCAYLIKLYPVNITFSLQEEEAEWVGLSVREALRKARNEEAVSTPPPLKDILTKELIARLEDTGGISGTESSTSSWMKKLSPFKDETHRT
ncbi:hypothetical protein ScPMuIL_010293 [Solemya velum]